MKKKNIFALALAAALALSLAACGGNNGGNGGSSSPVSGSKSGSGSTGSSAPTAEPTVVKVGVVGANNQQWDTVNELLAKDNIKVELVEFAEYKLPNNALDAGEIDLNAFQHKAYLQKEIDDLGYQVSILGDTIVAPLSLYSDKITDVSQLKEGDKIAVPSDPTNEGRCFKILESAGVLELGADALYTAAQIVTALQGLVGRLKSPTDPALIGVGVLRAGEGYNIVAREAVIEGTVRCFSEETRAMINGKIADTARGVAALYNTTAEIETESFTRALINDARVYAETAPLVEKVVGRGNLVVKELSLGGDDMAEIMAVVPGVYAFVGSGSEAVPGSRLAHHTPGFDIDERCLTIAASLYVESALFWLKQRT